MRSKKFPSWPEAILFGLMLAFIGSAGIFGLIVAGYTIYMAIPFGIIIAWLIIGLVIAYLLRRLL